VASLLNFTARMVAGPWLLALWVASAGPDEGAAVTPDAVIAEAAPDAEPAQAPAGSDVPAQEKKPPTPPHTGLRALGTGLITDITHLPSVDNMYLALMGGGLAIAAHPLDPTFNAHLRSHYTLVNDIDAPAKYYGDTPEQVALSLLTYGYGRLFDEPKVSHLGMDLIRAQLITEMMVEPLKFAVGRERPDGSNAQSFPSGHSAETFAAATVLERHLGWKHAAVAYAIAAYVASSRLHDNVHYLSDVAFGAAVGTIAGRTVTEHGANEWSIVPAGAPGGGLAVAFVKTTHTN